MSFAPQLSAWLVQAATVQDTPVVRVIRGETTWYDITSGTLQLIVLLLAVVVLGAMAWMLVSLKKGLDSLKETVEKAYGDARPIIATANQVAGDAREVVAMLRTDVERVTNAAGALSEQLLDVAAVTERRMDDINAVIDVVQGEVEETVLSTAASLRGLRMGGRAIAGALGARSVRGPRTKSERRRERERRRLLALEVEREHERSRERLTRDTAEHERERLARREERRQKEEKKREHG